MIIKTLVLALKNRIMALTLIIMLFMITATGCDIDEDLFVGGDLYLWDGSSWVMINPLTSGNVTASVNLTDNAVLRGDGGYFAIQDSVVTINDAGTVYTPADINTDSDINAGNDVNVTNNLDVTSDASIEGSLDIGNAVNGVTIDGIAGIEMSGSARVYNATWVDAGGIKAPGAKPATEVAHGLLETDAWQFADAITSNENTVSFEIRIPERMDRSEEPTITVGWSSTTTSGNCTWQLEYLWTSQDDDTTTGAEETLTVTTLSSTTAEGMTLTTFTGINNPSSTDVCIHCRLTRKSGSITDTISDTVELHGLCFRWISDKLGGEL
jgi:hypothetical protein